MIDWTISVLLFVDCLLVIANIMLMSRFISIFWPAKVHDA